MDCQAASPWPTCTVNAFHDIERLPGHNMKAVLLHLQQHCVLPATRVTALHTAPQINTPLAACNLPTKVGSQVMQPNTTDWHRNMLRNGWYKAYRSLNYQQQDNMGAHAILTPPDCHTLISCLPHKIHTTVAYWSQPEHRSSAVQGWLSETNMSLY